jgi:type IV pilus assembly protein PilW
MPRTVQFGRFKAGQRGFSFVELMIAVLLAVFLLGGLVTLVMGTRRTSGTQSAMSQLQDNQRIAMTMFANIVQKAGYFPDPTTQTINTFAAEAISGVNLAGSQVLGGTYNAAAPGDKLIVRFYAPQNDNSSAVINCAGQSNTTASTTVWYTNVFQIGTVNGTKWLQCRARTSGAGAILTINLIPNVTNISVLYGVASAAAGDDYSIVQYLNASQMTAANWLNVSSVKVTLTFLVPNYGTTGGQMTTNTMTFQRVIPIMSRAGVDT